MRDFVVAMLNDNGGCELPCWWGITPGETTWQTVQERFGLYYGQGFPQSDGTVYYDGPNYGGALHNRVAFGYYIAPGFFVRDGIVESIQISSQVLRNTTTSHFAQDWQRYSLSQMLSRYGMPSQVRIDLILPMEPPVEPEVPTASYGLTLVYDHLGFFVHYEGAATGNASVIRACPNLEETTFVFLKLQSPQLGRSLLSRSGEDTSSALEEATGIDLTTFYEVFQKPNSQVCLEGAPTWP